MSNDGSPFLRWNTAGVRRGPSAWSARMTMAPGGVEVTRTSTGCSASGVVTSSGTLLHVRGPVTTALDDIVRVYVPVERALVYPAE